MDQDFLVSDRLEEGHRLLSRLAADGFEVAAAFWIRTSDEGLWHLYIASPSINTDRIGVAYSTVYASLRQLPDVSLGLSEIKLIPATDPAAVAAAKLRARRGGGSVAIRGEDPLKLSAAETFIYPVSRPMKVLAEGKDQVLRYLEEQTLAGTGKPGEYLLARDERGELVAFIAGHSFVGGGTIRVGDKDLTISDGIVVKAET